MQKRFTTSENQIRRPRVRDEWLRRRRGACKIPGVRIRRRPSEAVRRIGPAARSGGRLIFTSQDSETQSNFFGHSVASAGL